MEGSRTALALDARRSVLAPAAPGLDVPKTLAIRVHDCPHCGLVLDRDVNAARVILSRASFGPGTGLAAQSRRVAA